MSSENGSGKTGRCFSLRKQHGRKHRCVTRQGLFFMQTGEWGATPQSNKTFSFSETYLFYGMCKTTVCFEKFWRTKINVKGSKWRFFYSNQGNVSSLSCPAKRKQLLEISDTIFKKRWVKHLWENICTY